MLDSSTMVGAEGAGRSSILREITHRSHGIREQPLVLLMFGQFRIARSGTAEEDAWSPLGLGLFALAETTTNR